jgi:hypothetical protein
LCQNTQFTEILIMVSADQAEKKNENCRDLDRGWLSQPTKMRPRSLFFIMAMARLAASCNGRGKTTWNIDCIANIHPNKVITTHINKNKNVDWDASFINTRIWLVHDLHTRVFKVVCKSSMWGMHQIYGHTYFICQ